jgi:glutamyl-tRNA reductase
MSTLLTVGIAHHDAPLAQLERVAVTSAARAQLRAQALAAGCAEILVLSTCSRVELHAVLDLPAPDGSGHSHDHDPHDHDRAAISAVAGRLVALLVGRGTGPVAPATVATGDDAVRHLFRVAAGLDSRILGETEVQAQLHAAARYAAAQDGDPHRLRRLVAAAVAAARAAATEQPRLLRRGLLAERAVERVLDAHPDRRPLDIMVVGAGTMGRQVLAALPPDRARATLLSRTSSARTGGPRIHPLDELPSRLAAADVVFVATSAGRRILRADLIHDVVASRPDRPLTVVDLSLPRNVDPAVAAVPGVRLLDLDDLGDAGSDVVPDLWALEAAETSTSAAAEDYCALVRSRRAGATIAALRDGVEQAALAQLRRTAKGLGLPEEALAHMAHAVAGAVAHRPTVLARQAAVEEDEATLALLRAAFGLADDVPSVAGDPAGASEQRADQAARRDADAATRVA